MPDLDFDINDKDHVWKIAEFEVEHEDVFHMKNLYKLIHEWFKMNSFVSVDSGDEKIETLYFEKILGNGNSEHHIWWRAHHMPQNSQYFKYYLKFDFQTLNMGKKEITHEGVKVKTNVGDVIMRCGAYLVIDYKKTWRNNNLTRRFYKLFLRYFYRNQIEYYKTDIWVKTYNLQDTIKQYLNLKTPNVMPKPFHNERGI